MSGDPLDDLAQRLARTIACAILGALGGAAVGACALASWGWNRPATRYWVPFDESLDVVVSVPVGAELN